MVHMVCDMYSSLSVLPVKASSCTGFQAVAEAVAEQWACAGIACNQATMRTEQRGEKTGFLFDLWPVSLFMPG